MDANFFGRQRQKTARRAWATRIAIGSMTTRDGRNQWSRLAWDMGLIGLGLIVLAIWSTK